MLRYMCMNFGNIMNTNKANNVNAIQFYDELLSQKIVEKNEEMKCRMAEVDHWKHAFGTIMKHTNYFRVKILQKDKLIQLLKKYNFEPSVIQQITK